MAKLIVPLPENASFERPVLLDEKGNEIWAYHCGEVIEIKFGNTWKKFRWEFDDCWGWYLLSQEMAFIPLNVKARLSNS